MTLTMTIAEREDFLAGLHVAVLSVDDPGHGPLTVPVPVLLCARRHGEHRHRRAERQGTAPAGGGTALTLRAERLHALSLRQRGRTDHRDRRHRLS